MYTNAITAIPINGARIPIAMDSDKLAIQLGIRAACCEDLSKIRISKIKDTLSLKELYISEGLLEDIKKNYKSELIHFEFDEFGNFINKN